MTAAVPTDVAVLWVLMVVVIVAGPVLAVTWWLESRDRRADRGSSR